MAHRAHTANTTRPSRTADMERKPSLGAHKSALSCWFYLRKMHLHAEHHVLGCAGQRQGSRRLVAARGQARPCERRRLAPTPCPAAWPVAQRHHGWGAAPHLVVAAAQGKGGFGAKDKQSVSKAERDCPCGSGQQFKVWQCVQHAFSSAPACRALSLPVPPSARPHISRHAASRTWTAATRRSSSSGRPPPRAASERSSPPTCSRSTATCSRPPRRTTPAESQCAGGASAGAAAQKGVGQ